MTGAVMLAAPAVAQQADPSPAVVQRTIAFNIPAQDLNAALLNFADRAGLQVFYDLEMVKGLRSAALNGSFTAQQGAAHLLAGTGMTYRFTGPNTVTLEKVQQANDGAMTLDPVTVEGRHAVPAQAEIGNLPPEYAGGQVARGAKLGLLGNRDIIDTPFNMTSYTSGLIENQQARTLAKVLENDPSIRFTTSGGHITENYSIRGLPLNSNDLALNGMYGLAPDGHVPMEFLERVEVLKGPNALLNGMAPSGGVGGAINLVPKRAGDTDVTNITGDFTSGSQLGTHVDVARRFGADKQFGVRVNGVTRDGETGVDNQTKERALGAVALDYRGDNLRLSLDAYSAREVYEGDSSAMAQLTGTSVPDAPDSSTNFFNSAGIYGQQENNAAVMRGEYDLNDNLTAYAAFGMANFRSAGFTNSTHAGNILANGQYTGQTTNRRGFTDNTSVEAGLRGRFRTADVGHEAVLSATTLDLASGLNFLRSATYASNIYAPVTPILAGNPGEAYTSELTTLSSIALADTLSFADDKVLLTLGARRQGVHSKGFNSGGFETSNYDEYALTPSVGVVVKPWTEPVSIYANYIEGLTKGNIVNNVAAANHGKAFAPYVSKQMETGVKWDAGKLTNTLSVFQITKRSLSSSGNIYMEGEQRNRGIEWNVFGELVENVRVLGGVTYTQAEVTKGASANLVGKTAVGVPEWQSNLGVEWDLPMVPGFTLEGRAVYTGSQYVNSTNVLSIPEWQRFDAGARYTIPVYSKDVTFRSYVTNLLDEDYWAGSFSDGYVTLSEPRTFMFSATVGL